MLQNHGRICYGNTDTETDGNQKSDMEESPQVLVFGRGGDSVSLDPAIVTDGESFKVTQNIFETLLNFGEEDTTIDPGLAKNGKLLKMTYLHI